MTRRTPVAVAVVTAVVTALVVTGAGVASAGEVPTPVADPYDVDYQTTLRVPAARGLLVNDDPGPYTAPVVTGVDTTGLAGTVAVDEVGSFRFTPAAGFHGETAFTYRIADGPGGQVSVTGARVVFTVGDVAARPDAYHLAVDVPALVVDDASRGVLANDESAGLGVGGASLAAAPGHGTVDLADDGTFTYVPTARFAGVDTFSYTVTGATNSSTTTVTVTVDPPNVDLAVALRSDVTAPPVGSTFSVRVAVRNGGPRPAGSVAVGLDVAAGLLVTAAPGGVVTNGGASVVWSVPRLGVGKVAVWTVSVTVQPAARGSRSIVAAARSLGLVDLTPDNDRRSVAVRAVAP